MTKIEQIILEAIKRRDKTNPIRNGELRYKVQKYSGEVINERAVRLYIANLRTQGYPILATKGYFFAESIDDIESYQRTILAHARAELKTVSVMKKMYPQFAGQQILV